MPFGKVGMEERMKELHIDRNGENGYLCGTYDLCILITEYNILLPLNITKYRLVGKEMIPCKQAPLGQFQRRCILSTGESFFICFVHQ